MQLGSTTVVTPQDNPCQYDPDWRNSLAMALVDDPGLRLDFEYVDYKDDPWVKKQVEYLKLVKRSYTKPGYTLKLTEDQKCLRLASIWNQGTRPSDVKFRIEPLLLTAVSLEAIRLDIGGEDIPLEAFKAYEKLYFNIRTDDFRLNKSCQLRQYFALPDGQFDQDTPVELVWKMVGALMGYDTLVNIWLWTDAHGLTHNSQDHMLDEMWRVAQSRLFLNMFRNTVGNESMAKLLSAFTAQSKLLQDSKAAGGQSLDTTKALMAILYKSSPKIISVAKDVDTVSATTQVIRERLALQQAIGKTKIDDAGKEVGNRILQGQIENKFKETK